MTACQHSSSSLAKVRRFLAFLPWLLVILPPTIIIGVTCVSYLRLFPLEADVIMARKATPRVGELLDAVIARLGPPSHCKSRRDAQHGDTLYWSVSFGEWCPVLVTFDVEVVEGRVVAVDTAYR